MPETKWVSEWGDEFETEEEARDDALEKMDWNDYVDEFEYLISYRELLDWARQQPGFWERFEQDASEAEGEFFDRNYHEEESEE